MKHFISRRNFLKAAGVTAAASAMAAAVPQASAGFLTGKDAAVTILYTNDVHTYIDNKSPKLTYAAIAPIEAYLCILIMKNGAVKKELAANDREKDMHHGKIRDRKAIGERK